MADVKIGQTAGISVVDYGPFLDGSRKQEVADAIIASFKEIGFVYLVNHGLEAHKVNGMFDWVRSLPSRPAPVAELAPVQTILLSTARGQTSSTAPGQRSAPQR